MFVSTSEEEWDAVIRVHLKGHYCAAQYAASYWRDRSKAKKPVEVTYWHSFGRANEETIQRLTARFRRTAVTPETAAARILEGIERNRYWVYTSRDIQVGHFLQRRFETGYAIVMRLVNDRFSEIMRRAHSSFL